MRITALTALALGLLASAAAPSASAATRKPVRAAAAAAVANPASEEVRRFTDWVIASGDSRGLPFVIVDKKNTEVFVFRPEGTLRGAAPALVGLATGDLSVPGIGDRKLSDIRPEERTTPAGRFVAALGHDLGEKDIVWVDYAAAISMHRVITGNPKDRRLHRLATPRTTDNRITYGCINVPVRFYDEVVGPTFKGTSGIVYILPEVRPVGEIFPAYASLVDRAETGAASPH